MVPQVFIGESFCANTLMGPRDAGYGVLSGSGDCRCVSMAGRGCAQERGAALVVLRWVWAWLKGHPLGVVWRRRRGSRLGGGFSRGAAQALTSSRAGVWGCGGACNQPSQAESSLSGRPAGNIPPG